METIRPSDHNYISSFLLLYGIWTIIYNLFILGFYKNWDWIPNFMADSNLSQMKCPGTSSHV